MKEYIVRYEDNKFTIEGEIVRCKYCKWKVQHLCMNKDAQAFYMEVDADDYCSYGEKQVTGKNACGDYFDEEWLYNELEQIAERHHPETPTISEKESVEGDLFNKSLWRMGMHDTNVRPCTMADTSTDTDLISRQAAINAVKKWFVEEYNSMPYEYDEEVKDNVFTDMKWVNISLEHNKEIRKVLKSLPPVEPKPVCEDAISRADTLKAICAECDVNCEDCINKEAYCTEYAVVKSLPPVEPKRPKGKWIPCSEPPKDRRNVFLADMGNNQFGTEVSADMRGEK